MEDKPQGDEHADAVATLREQAAARSPKSQNTCQRTTPAFIKRRNLSPNVTSAMQCSECLRDTFLLMRLFSLWSRPHGVHEPAGDGRREIGRQRVVSMLACLFVGELEAEAKVEPMQLSDFSASHKQCQLFAIPNLSFA